MKKDFESRFMPSAKFSIMGENRDLLLSIGIPIMCNYVRTSFNGDIVALCDCKTNFEKWEDSKEVSIYEAIPELIPDGMRYNKELDKLVPDVMQWEKVDNGGNHIAADGTPFDTIEEALNHNCTLVSTSSADEYCSGIKVELEKVMDHTDKKENNPIEPNHYTEMKISPLEYIEANQGDFTWCIANVIKYVSRHKRKNGIEDLKKAQWYLNHEINRLEIIEGMANVK